MTASVPGQSLAGPAGVAGVPIPPAPIGVVDPAVIARAVEPEMSRISVLCGNTQIDVALPAHVPIAALLPELARLMLRNEFGEARQAPEDLSSQWALGKVGEPPFDDARTLVEAGVYDGDLLVLHTDTIISVPTLYDDVIDAVAGINRREFNAWTPASSRWLGIVGTVMAALSAAAWILLGHWQHHPVIVAVIGFVGAVALFGAATLSSSVLEDQALAAGLTTAACAVGFVGGYTILPGSDRSVGWLLGAAIVAVIALLSLRLTAGHPFTHMALLSTSILVAIGATVQVLWQAPIAKSTAITAIIALLTVLIAPRLTILFTRLPIPTVPSAGVNLETVEAPQHNNVNVGVSAIGALALPEATALEVRAKAANSYMAGLMFGSALVAVVAATLTALPRPDFYWQGITLAILVSISLCLRGRSHADLLQAASLIAVGLAGVLAALAVLSYSGETLPIVAFGLAIICAAASAYFGVLAPRTDFSPVMRRLGEILEYLLVTATVPLAAWVIGVYGLARGL